MFPSSTVIYCWGTATSKLFVANESVTWTNYYSEKNLRFSQLEFRVSDFWCVWWYFWAILGCSRMLLIFGTSQSKRYFPLERQKALKFLKIILFHRSIVRFFSWTWIHLPKKDFLPLICINLLINTLVLFGNQLECVLFIRTKALFQCQLQPTNCNPRSSNVTNEGTLSVQTKQIF